MTEEKENKQDKKDLLTISQQSKKENIIKTGFKKEKPQKGVFVFEENISQPKKKENEIIKNKNNKTIKPSFEKKKEEIKTNDTEYLRRSIEKTFDKYKNKNIEKEKEKIFDKGKVRDKSLEVDLDNVNTRNRKVTYIQRRKPTFRELREKVLHKNPKTSTSTFY